MMTLLGSIYHHQQWQVLLTFLHKRRMNCYTSSDSTLYIILHDLLEEIRLAKFFTVLADEVTASNLEHLAICIRFVDVHSDIMEELTFQQLELITGKHIAEAIIEYLQENGLQVENIRGQGYDGASNMSSSRSGVQARIQ